MISLNQILVFIASAIIMVPLFHRLGLGSVLGYLIAGIVVGPHGFAYIKDSESVLHFAELGVVFLLFIIGLEMRPSKLWSMKKQLIGLGLVQIIICSVVFMLILQQVLGLSLIPAIIVGVSLSLSSTAFAVQSLTEKNLMFTEFGRSSFSVLLTQDLIAIPTLAIIPLFAHASAGQQIQQPKIYLLLPVLLGLIICSKYLLGPLFRIVATTRVREIFTATTLFIVLGVAATMQKIGLSAALGTFLSGVLLANSEYRHELEANLEPFKNLLMGLFFIAVGMGVSIEYIEGHLLLVFLSALAYLSIKIILIYGIGRLNKMNHENAKSMAVSIAQGGEFAFVIFGMALALNLLPLEPILYLTAVISLSMAINPLITKVIDQLTVLNQQKKPAPKYDEIPNVGPQVIIAGLGRFGQMFARLLRSQSIPFVAIDHNSDQIDQLRKFGHLVYYGDARREDILIAAGAANARYFILAIDDVDISIECADIVIRQFPHLKIFARVRNRGHAFELMEKGIEHIKRETFDSSVNFVAELFEEMNYTKERAAELIEKFKTHDEIMMHEQFKVRKDDLMFISVSKQATAQFSEVLRQENAQSYIKPFNNSKKKKK